MKKYSAIIICFFFIAGVASPQDKKHISLNGYLTSLQSVIFDSLRGPFQIENMIHNRLNIKGYSGSNFTFSAELRNRLISGDLVRQGRPYAEMIDSDKGLLDMSWNVIEQQSFLLNTSIDRLWIDLHSGNFQMTIGRQRINWGQTLVWNPNDIFNAYNFFDFDYTEKPGSDALRIQYFTSSSSVGELAIKVNSNNDPTMAGLFRFNKWGYDLQLLAGVVDGEDIVLGTGWSGALGNMSFRGEASWFDNYRDFPGDEGAILITTGCDKVFKDNSMAQVQIMYSNNPLSLNDFSTFYSGRLSPKDLAFSRFSAFGQFTWATTPLLRLSASAMWFPDPEGYFAGPALEYSLSENLDFSILWQHFNSIMGGSHSRINLAFLKMKYSF